MSSLIVELEGICAGYEGRDILHDLDFQVEHGAAVALLGANGSGKSTLVRTILGLVPASEGTRKLFDVPVHKFRRWERVGYVPQRLGAGGGVPATVAEVVAAGRLSRRRLLWPSTATDRRIVTESLDRVGLADHKAKAVSQLSGGQQQRVLIARALAAQPDLLIMDEPVAGVDAQNQEVFTQVLTGHLQQGGTFILVAHELGPVEPLITRAVVLSQGAIVHDGAVPPLSDAAGHHVHAHDDLELWSR